MLPRGAAHPSGLDVRVGHAPGAPEREHALEDLVLQTAAAHGAGSGLSYFFHVGVDMQVFSARVAQVLVEVVM